MRGTWVVLIGLAFAGRAVAQTGTVAGRVLDAAGGAPIAGAVVAGGGQSATTGGDGAYVLTGVPAGLHGFTATRSGYAAETRPSVRVAANTLTSLEFRLRSVPAARPASTPVAAADTPPPDVRKERSAATRGAQSEARVDSMLGALHGAPSAAPMGGVVRGAGKSGSYGHGIGTGSAAPLRPTPRHSRAMVASAPAPTEVAGDGAPPEHGDREGYDSIRENPYLAVRQSPLSTFSIDVDTAAYANVRRFLDQRRLPPRDAVRIEELINYFPYRYPDPTGEHPFSVTTEVTSAPWNPAHRLLRVGVQGKRIESADLPPSNLVFLVDVSGSMNTPDKLPLATAALKLLVQNLRKQDRVAMVVYAGAAGVVLPPTAGSDKGRILDALDRLQAGGSTAGGAGIRLAYQVARDAFLKGGNNRVILLTDGDFNVGVSSDGDMVQLIEKERQSGVFLSVLGFGTGNYQDAKMQKLADAGNGHHAYMDTLLEAKKVFVTEMGATLFTIAQDVKIQIEFNPAKIKGYRLIGYENRLLRDQDFNDDRKDAGELGAGHSVTALYELIDAGSDEGLPGVDPLKYQRTAESPASGSDELLTVKLRYKAPRGDTSKLLSHVVRDERTAPSADLQFASAVAEFGLILRDSEHKGRASFDAVLDRARRATTPETDPEGYRDDFVKLVEGAQLLHATTRR